MAPTDRDSWQVDGPGASHGGTAAAQRSRSADWLRGPLEEEAFSRPISVGPPVRQPRPAFVPLAARAMADGSVIATVMLGGSVLQRRPIGDLNSFSFKLSICGSELYGVRFETWIIRRDDRRR